MDDIEAELNLVFAELLTLQGSVRAEAREQGIDPFRARHSDGEFIMLPIILAKSRVLAALAPIQQERLLFETRGEMLKQSFLNSVEKPAESVILCGVCSDKIRFDEIMSRYVHSNGFTCATEPEIHDANP